MLFLHRKVEIAYNWVIVRPHHVVKPQPEEDGSNCAAVIPTERVQDVESAFSIEPSSGVLPSEGTVQFTLTYAPPLVSWLFTNDGYIHHKCPQINDDNFNLFVQVIINLKFPERS